MAKHPSIDVYIADFPQDVQTILQDIRSLIGRTAPKAEEYIGYGMPGFRLNGKPLVYFAGYKNHIGFYATPSGHEEFVDELAKYKQGKGSVQFPLTDFTPMDLIRRIVEFRVNEVSGKTG